MEIRVLKTIEELELYKANWDRILQENKNDIPFIEFDWIRNWWSFFGNGHELFILLISECGNIAGFSPTMLTKKRFYYEIGFIGFPHANIMDFIISEKYKEQSIKTLINYLLNYESRLILNFHGMFKNSWSFNIIKDYLKLCGNRHFYIDVESMFIKTNESYFEEYFKSRCTHESIKNIQRVNKKLQKLGTISYSELDSQLIDEIFNLHTKRWLKKVDTSGFSEGNTKDFFKHLALEKSLSYKTSVGSLCLNDKVIAFIYGFECRGRFLLYSISHDNIFSIYGPGKIALREEIKKSFLHENKIFDFSIGYERYKAEWTDNIEYVSKIIFTPDNLVSGLIFISRYLKEKSKWLLKRNKRIVNFKRNTLGNIRYFISSGNWTFFFNRLKSSFKSNGLTGLISGLAQKITKLVYYKDTYILYKRKLVGNFNKIHPEYLAREATIVDLTMLADLMNTELENIVSRFYKNYKCIVIEREGQIIHCQWIDLSNIGVKGFNQPVKLESNRVCIYDIYTKREYPDSNIFQTFLPNILTFLRQNNFTNCYYTLNSRDKIASNALYKGGFKSEFTIKRKKLFKKTRFVVESTPDK